MSFPYKKILVIGATSGIGWGLAERFVEKGHKVIVSGRRKEKLDEFVSKYGSDKADAAVVDITKLSELSAFAETITSKHPDLDCVFLNSGIQRGFNFAKPATVDLNSVETELTTNYTAVIHLSMAFLPHLQSLSSPTSLIYTTSGLALAPILRCANYCASKAALHHWILVFREQVKLGPGDVSVIEIYPPAVQTELHDAKHQPDIKDGGSIGMPLSDFTDECWEGLSAGKDQIAVGIIKPILDGWESDRQKQFHRMVEIIKKDFNL